MNSSKTETIEIKIRCRAAEELPLSELTPMQGDLKSLNRDAFEKLKLSIEKKGFLFPFFAWKSNGKTYYLDGTQRDRVLREMAKDERYKLPEKFPIAYIEAANKKEAAEIILLQSSRYGRLSEESLADFFGEFDLNFGELEPLIDLPDIGMDFNPIDVSEEDEPFSGQLIEPPKNPVTKKGDVWLLGSHRLMCGDCRNPQDVEKLFKGHKAHIVVTSPPYAAQRKYDENSGFSPVDSSDYIAWYDAVQTSLKTILTENGSYFLNMKEHCEKGQRDLYVKDLLIAHVRRWSWQWIDEFAWVHGGTPRQVVNRFKNGWESIFHFALGKFKFRPEEVRHKSDDIPDWNGNHFSEEEGTQFHNRKEGVGGAQGKGLPRGGIFRKSGPNLSKNQGNKIDVMGLKIIEGMAYPSNVLSLGKNREALGHGAAFPVSLPQFFLKAYSDPKDTIYDPFMGSGTVLATAHIQDRVAYGMEVSPAYCDIIVHRYETLTKEKAVLES